MPDLIPISKELQRLSIALAKAIDGFGIAIVEAAEARTEYDVAWAKALLSQAEGTVREKEAEATLIVKDLMRTARIAEANRDAYKERVKAIQAVLSVQQSLLRHMEESNPTGF